MFNKKESPHSNIQSRRTFFKSVLGEAATMVESNFSKSPIGKAISIAGESNSKPCFRLSDLWSLPDKTLAQIKPSVFSNIDIRYKNESVYACFNTLEKKVFIFENNSENTFVFNRFDKNLSLDEIGKELSIAMNWNDDKSFSHVKNLFLSLVEKRICIPSNPIG